MSVSAFVRSLQEVVRTCKRKLADARLNKMKRTSEEENALLGSQDATVPPENKFRKCGSNASLIPHLISYDITTSFNFLQLLIILLFHQKETIISMSMSSGLNAVTDRKFYSSGKVQVVVRVGFKDI